MDRITSSYLEEFVAKYNIEGDESVQFEHFSNFSLLDRYSNDKFDFLAANISANGTLGIDGFAIFIIGHRFILRWTSIDGEKSGNIGTVDAEQFRPIDIQIYLPLLVFAEQKVPLPVEWNTPRNVVRHQAVRTLADSEGKRCILNDIVAIAILCDNPLTVDKFKSLNFYCYQNCRMTWQRFIGHKEFCISIL